MDSGKLTLILAILILLAAFAALYKLDREDAESESWGEYGHDRYRDADPDNMCMWLEDVYRESGREGLARKMKPMAIHRTPEVLACLYEMAYDG